MAALELWAGPECSVNRVAEVYRDQLEYSGFAHRIDDLDRLAGLGIRRLRFPLLWERTAPEASGELRWRWSDERLARLRELGVEPIVGLLHHGSGPRYTNLLDPVFPERFAAYAQAVADRHPAIEAYTPINEPLTTARFSGLYGFWYPHRNDDVSFVRALLNQLRGTVLAMRAIRAVNPNAELVQTEDLGYTDSCLRLRYQARFENHRRWLTFDLLTGRVDRHHPFWRYLREAGASEHELAFFCEQPCPPDVIGINCYVTSERFLDDRLTLYPRQLHGGNRRHRYVDVETVRVEGGRFGGFAARLREASARYGRPVAITEAHLGCSRDEQLRWLHQAWQAAQTVRGEGADIRAVTVWAAFGTYDWNSLLTCDAGHYEPGLWDVRGPVPRRTALGTLAAQLGRDGTDATLAHPVLAVPGWWQRDVRLLYPPPPERPLLHADEPADSNGRPLLVTGATGTLGRAFARLCTLRGLPFRLLTRNELDIADAASVDAALERWQPWAIINTAGFVRVDAAEHSEHQARHWRDNALGPAVLAQACARSGARLLSFSSDLVFDGSKDLPYVESDAPGPLNAYGRSKLEAERRMLALAPDSLVIRSSAFFGPWDEHNFVTLALAAIARGERWHAADDQFVSPTYVPDLVHASLDLLIDGEQGLWHLANRGAVSWLELAHLAAEAACLDRRLIAGVPGASLGQQAPRPRYSVLESERGALLPSLMQALDKYMQARPGLDAEISAVAAAQSD
jgi:dTDP-4-dehydrorhamnose reductase